MPHEWMNEALCTFYDPDIWFKTPVKTAKRICNACPVILECRIYCLKHRLMPGELNIIGVWGGLTYADRKNPDKCVKLLAEAEQFLEKRMSYGRSR